MKIWLSILASFVILNTAFAQLEKAAWMAGGSGSLQATKTSFQNSGSNVVSDRLEVSISAPIGLFVLDKLAVGLKPSYEKFRDKVDDGGYSNENRFGIGPFVRYYFLDKDKQFNILSDIGYQYGLYRFKPRKGDINTFSAMSDSQDFLQLA